MKTYISITGQINSVTTLKNNIKGGEVKKIGNNYYIQYQTKKEAKQSLQEAFNYLIDAEPSYEEGISIYNKKECLIYDAGFAKLHEGKIS